jgi:hypothetical protein
MTHRLARSTRLSAALGSALALCALAVVTVPESAGAASLVGTLRLIAGSCSGSTVTGTYLRMILPSGNPSGPYMSNSDSTCHDQSYTPLAPGSDGGLAVGQYQPQPSPPFDAKGNALADRITAPATFYGTAFATSTNRVDPQTGRQVPAPQLTVSGSSLSADLRSFAVTWNNQYFNQGSPKPDGSEPGNTRTASGTYNPATHAFTLNWTSQVVGGPFDKFTGQWHLQGTFVPATANSAGSGAAAGGGVQSGNAGVTAQGSGASGQQGQASVNAAASAAHRSGASHVTAQPVAVAQANGQPAASITTVTRDHWHVAWWLVGLAVGIAVVGFAALLALQRIGRRPGTPA